MPEQNHQQDDDPGGSPVRRCREDCQRSQYTIPMFERLEINNPIKNLLSRNDYTFGALFLEKK